MSLALRILIGFVGALLALSALRSALLAFVLPRSAHDALTRFVFISVRSVFRLRLLGARSYLRRDAVMAAYAPVSLLALVFLWITLIGCGYALMFYAAGEHWARAMTMSGSSLLTLGFAQPTGALETAFVFSEAAIGLVIIALLIAYLPTMYAAFSRREAMVSMLEMRAGSPPSGVELLVRTHRLHGVARLETLWSAWESWFVEIEESHTSLAALTFFRSPQPHRAWVTASGAVLDAAALTASTLLIESSIDAQLCVRAGSFALGRIADFFRLESGGVNANADQMIHVTRGDFDLAYRRFKAEGLPVRDDQESAWQDFRTARAQYDQELLVLGVLTMAPDGPWSRFSQLERRDGTLR